MSGEKVKVLYIGGMMRSGSTLLGRLLGELPGAFNVGELGLLLSSEFRSYGRCGCLQPVYECPFWEAVFEEAFGGIQNLDIETLHATRQNYRIRSLPRLLFARRALKRQKRFQEYIRALEALYAAVAKVSGARYIVDSSKDALFGYLLEYVPRLDLRAVHLVRDSRAVAFSYQRVKTDPPLFANPGQLTMAGPVPTALMWNGSNALLSVKKLGQRSCLLRYEDFVADPRRELTLLYGLLEEPLPSLDFLDSPAISLQTNHTVAGNPDRFHSQIRIKLDNEWEGKMKPAQRALVTSLTLPLLLYYGYLTRPPARERVKCAAPMNVL